ncbi:uncharacterized protein BJ212DRAFT_253507 [Suillus subaureus]|uniref:Uncharacterized protein n=1 Tax=Suillus subaureus TaxID=48587 RepID=A0A9P7JCW1_9AGAM|nr:uncharacterized protein BJ212DRAFT_253507 [Suillus subaureus]KAG1815069.1 hypothetical protein BJ212DRAFT_253507 [Suillus subaureus]
MPTECRQQVRYLHHPLSSSLVGVSCSSWGIGRNAFAASRTTPRVELRSTIFRSFVFDFFLAWTHGRSSWIPIFFPLFPLSLYLSSLFSFLLCYSLGPRSPVSHSRDIQYPPTLPSSNDPDISPNELPSAARQNSRFIQVPSAQIDQRISDLPDKPSREPRRQARSLSADGTGSHHRASDRHKADARAHESPDMAPQTLPQAPREQLVPLTPSPPIERSRKRVPLPPQRDSFQEGSRGRADVGYRSPPSATRDSAPASRLIANDVRIPSGPRLSPLETSRDIRSSDARGSRQAHSRSAPHSNSQTDTYAHNESRDKRGKDHMDVDDPPPSSIIKSTEPSRQLMNSQRYREDRDGSAPKRPRAMMDDVDMPARRRSPDRSPKLSRSEWKEPRRTVHEDVSRAPPLRDERRAPVESSTRPRLDIVYDRERSTKISADQHRQTERVVSPLLPRKPLSVLDPPVNAPINTDSPSRLGARAARVGLLSIVVGA